jgi:succinoglycan biosynthesis protein ExoA
MLPSVTVVIAARPDQAEIKAVNAGKQLKYPREKLEIIVARGKQPSVQRNAAIRAARGELIYFLDDDSVPPSDNLQRAVGVFANPQVKMLGGPNLCPPEAPFLEHVFALVQSSKLAFFSSAARYARLGARRETSEKELILCNLIARRSDLLELGGFNEALYPNEENALMDDLLKRGGKLIYDPDLIVYRRPRSTLKSFGKMLLNYGRGRAEQVRLHPTLRSAPNFAPPLFLVYLVISPFLGIIGVWPLLAYGLAVLLQAVALALRGGIAQSVCAIPLIVLVHVLYGVGFWHGLFTPVKNVGNRPKIDVDLQNVPF